MRPDSSLPYAGRTATRGLALEITPIRVDLIAAGCRE